MKPIFRPGFHYAKCGVILTDLVAEGQEQPDLLDTRDQDRRKRLMTALDAVNRRMDRDTLFYAAAGIRRDWKAFANMKSEHFTTDWRHMPRIKV